MDISISNYHRDITEKRLRIFLLNGKLGIHNLDNDKKTMPSFDRVVTSDKYLFVEVDSRWGILAKDLSLIASPMYNEIYPIKLTDRERFISNCLSNRSTVSLTLDSNSNTPTHIAIQKGEISSRNKYGIDMGDLGFHSMTEYNEDEKACIYEIINSLENIQTDLFVIILDKEVQLIDIGDIEIKQDTGFRGYEFFPLWHYKDNMFIIGNNNGTYVTSTYKDGRFTKKSLWGEYNDSFEEYGSPKVVVHRSEFISVCYPENFRFIGSPFANQRKEKEFDEKRGKWALFKYYHSKTEEDDERWHKFLSNERTCFEQLTSYVFERCATQLQNDNEFIFNVGDRDFIMRFEPKELETNEMIEFDETIGNKPCSQGQLSIIACHESIEVRDDGMIDIFDEGKYGLCDQNMRVIVPAKYDYPMKWGNQLMIVSQNEKYGVINTLGEEVVPCQYEYIQVGKGDMQIWDWDCEWDNVLVDAVDICSINHKVEIIPPNDDLIKEGYIIVGILLEQAKIPKQVSNPTTILDKLKNHTVQVQKPKMLATHCDIYLPNGKFIGKCSIGKLGIINYSLDEGILLVSDRTNSVNSLKRYGIYITISSAKVLKSDHLSNDIQSLSGNDSEGYYNLEEIIITKDVNKVEWNGLGRCRFRKFNVVPENNVFCEVDGVLYTQKGFDRKGDTHRKHMIELVACPTNVTHHDVMPGTMRIGNCAFKGSRIESLNLPDTLEEIGVNAFYHTPNLKYLKLPISLRKIEAQDVGLSGDLSPQIEYDSHSFMSWDSLYKYMLEKGFDKKNGNIVNRKGI